MKIVVAIKHIPNVADEIDLNSEGSNLDFDEYDFMLNEFDEHAIEQAVLIREAVGGTVIVIGVDLIEELDTVLHSALAKGADEVIKIVGDIEPGMDTHTHATHLAKAIKELSPDLVLAGIQAADDIDGQIGPMLAANLDMPYIGVVTEVEAAGDALKVHKEYSGGVMAEFELSFPGVLGIQAASSPPRYAPISKVRQMAKTATIEEVEIGDGSTGSGLTHRKMSKPESSGHTEMLEGSAKEVAAKLLEIINERGLL